MLLFHGSNIVITQPKLIPSLRLKDQYAFKTEKALNALVFKEAVL